MDVTASDIRATTPRVLQTAHGWLAVSRPGSVIRIGVVGATPDEAAAAFAVSIEAWALLHEKPEPVSA